MSKQPNRFFNVTSANGNLTLDLYDYIGAVDYDGDGITEGNVSAALKNSDAETVTLNINSPGGDAFQGVAIHNVLAQSGKNVIVNVVGLAASAASIVAMAGDTITMHAGSVLMIHPAQAMAMGSADDMRKLADTLDTVTGAIADIYVATTGLDKAKVLDMMQAETWMDAADAVKQGFATATATDKQAVQNGCDLSILNYKRVPEKLLNVTKTKEVDGEHLTPGDFIYVGNPDDTSTWSLPWKFSTDEKTKSHLRDALARFDQDEVIPESHKDEAWAKLLRLCKEHGIDVSRRGNPKNSAAVCTCTMSDTTRCAAHPEGFSLSLLARQLEINKRK